MAFNYSKLKGKIKEVYGTQNAFADGLNMGRGSLSAKLNNHTEFTQREMKLSCALLGVSEELISDYFFCLDGS